MLKTFQQAQRPLVEEILPQLMHPDYGMEEKGEEAQPPKLSSTQIPRATYNFEMLFLVLRNFVEKLFINFLKLFKFVINKI